MGLGILLGEKQQQTFDHQCYVIHIQDAAAEVSSCILCHSSKTTITSPGGLELWRDSAKLWGSVLALSTEEQFTNSLEFELKKLLLIRWIIEIILGAKTTPKLLLETPELSIRRRLGTFLFSSTA